jgi:hypothetical protein
MGRIRGALIFPIQLFGPVVYVDLSGRLLRPIGSTSLIKFRRANEPDDVCTDTPCDERSSWADQFSARQRNLVTGGHRLHAGEAIR